MKGKKIMILLCVFALLFAVGCELEEETEKPQETEITDLDVTFDKVRCRSYSTIRSRSTICYYFDSNSNKTINISKNNDKYSYREGTYLGDFNDTVIGCYENYKDSSQPCTEITFEHDITDCDDACITGLKKKLIESGRDYLYKKENQ